MLQWLRINFKFLNALGWSYFDWEATGKLLDDYSMGSIGKIHFYLAGAYRRNFWYFANEIINTHSWVREGSMSSARFFICCVYFSSHIYILILLSNVKKSNLRKKAPRRCREATLFILLGFSCKLFPCSSRRRESCRRKPKQRRLPHSNLPGRFWNRI